MPKKEKTKPTIEEQLGLTGTETASQLYSIYVKHYTSNSKLTSQAREIWKKKYYQEKKSKNS
jgi:hypothetical protein